MIPTFALRRRTLVRLLGAGAADAAVVATAGLPGCAAFSNRDPVTVDVVGVEPARSESLELRFMLKLRVQNPNDQPIEFDGVYAELELRGSRLASGVTNQRGTVPRFGEALIALPVTVPMSAMVRQALGLVTGDDTRTDYRVRGKLNGPLFGSVRFESTGELRLPS